MVLLGGAVSIVMFCVNRPSLLVPVSGRVKSAGLFAASTIVPPLRVSAKFDA